MKCAMNAERKDEVVELCRGLIRERSYSGEEQGAAAALSAYFRKRGFDGVEADGYGNVVGRVRGAGAGPRVLLDGHIDTVKAENRSSWTVDPFAGEVRDGRVYGRGASDMKGAVAAMACAVAFFAEDSKRAFGGELCLAGVVHEECFEGIAARSVSAALKPDFVVIGEASELNLKIGQRGRAEVVVETFGVPAHSANPDKGANAVYMMMRIVEELRRLEPPEHASLGKGILELTDIKSSPYPGASVVPEYCRATYDRRLLVGETKESVLAPLRDALVRAGEGFPSFRAEVSFARGEESCYTGSTISGERFFPGWCFDPAEPWIGAALGALRGAGLGAELSKYNFCTNGSHYAGEAGISTLGYGPSRENLAHTVDEHVEIAQLHEAVAGYYAIIGALLGAGERR